MWTSIFPDCCTTAAPMPSSKMRAHRDRRDVPSTSWVAFSSRAKSSRALGTSSPTTVCRWRRGCRPARAPCPSAGPRHPASPSPRTTCTTSSSAAGLRRDPGCAAHQGLRLRAAGEGDDDTFAGLPGVGDLVLGAVLLERLVDLVGQPQQRQLAQRGEVADAGSSWTARRRPSRARRRCRGPPAPQRLRGDVDQLDLVGGAHDLVGHGLPLRHAGDLLDDVVERLEVLDVDRGDDVDAGVEQLLDVLPALGVAAARARWCGPARRPARPRGGARQHRVDVHLGELASRGSSMYLRRDDLQALEQRRRCACGRGSRRQPTTTSVPRSSRRCASSSIA